jgi:hypothetical protein
MILTLTSFVLMITCSMDDTLFPFKPILPDFHLSVLIYSIIDYDLKSTLFKKACQTLITGRSKRDIPLPIFKNEPVGRNNDYTDRSIRAPDTPRPGKEVGL